MPPLLVLRRIIKLGVNATIERAGHWRTVAPFEQTQDWPAGEGKIEPIQGDEGCGEVRGCAAFDHLQGDGCIDVVESRYAAGAFNHPLANSDPLGHIGANDDQIRSANRGGEALFQIPNAFVNNRAAERRTGKVARRFVPGRVPLQEEHFVAAGDQLPH
jgi:hypothetical protein